MTSCFVVYSSIRHRGYTAGHRLVHVHVGQRGAHAAAYDAAGRQLRVAGGLRFELRRPERLQRVRRRHLLR